MKDCFYDYLSCLWYLLVKIRTFFDENPDFENWRVGRDSNPRSPKAPDLQSGTIGRSVTYPLLYSFNQFFKRVTTFV